LSIKQLFLPKSGRIEIAGAPPGVDAMLVGDFVRSGRPVVHVARDDARMATLAEELAFFHPDAAVLTLPAWDCLPYDRVSPNGEVVARRIATLAALAQPDAKPPVLITTVNAALQRVPKRALFAHTAFAAKVGGRLDLKALTAFLAHNGYTRSDTVREAGEYAVRGGIVDLFPPGSDDPLRLDLFGDTLEGIRTFDPMSQRTRGKVDQLLLRPVSEVFLDDASVQRFRSGYRELFGAVDDDDPLYAAISAGTRYPGFEHWLPLFHDRLETVFDYAPDAAVTLDHQADEAIVERLAQIAEYYETRRGLARGRQAEGAPYRPLPPDRLYLTADEWAAGIKDRAVGAFSPFARPESATVVDAGGKPGQDFAPVRNKPGASLFDTVRAQIAEEHAAGRRVVVTAYSAGSRDRLGGLLRDHGIERVVPVEGWAAARKAPANDVGLVVLGLERGFVTADTAFITEQDILGDRLVRAGKRRIRSDNFLTEASTLAVGDLVVHVDHGIGRFDGLATLEVSGAAHDMLRLIYEGNDKLFVPVENIDVLSRFGSEEAGAQLDKLGGMQWQARKARVKQRITEMADKLIAIAAARQVQQGEPMLAPQGVYDEFCARFPYPETEDQARAIDDTIGDLSSGRSIDRLICGDVGFGKTEVALRAAFVAAMAGSQVAVVVPTTLLSRQHYRTFTTRFQGMPVRIAQLSRLVSAKDAADIKRDLAAGNVDIVVGTTALLAKSMEFKNLGLLIVDEEQHFGVGQKERLKQLKANVHVLTLTATPIPRTLQMALTGVRDMSIIASPPVDRLAVRTFVLPFDPVVIREAIMRERMRGGQVFYVSPRIEDLDAVRERLQELVPECRIAVAHGQLSAAEIENIMTKFTDGGFDILLSTNIIESGLDIPRVNTIVIHRADMFGLAQLYQLRGRVGRAKTRAYAYLTVPPNRILTPAAQKRLEVMQTLDSLGAGFQLASYDLDIRGAGNLLGEEQSGHIQEVGIELYQHMLEEAVRAARAGGGVGAAPAADWAPQINLGMPVLIPDTYVQDLDVRLGLYRRLASIEKQEEIDGFAAELIDRFGKLPAEVENLLQVITIKKLCRAAGVDKIEVGPKGAIIGFRENKFANPEKLIGFITKKADVVKLRPDHKLVFLRAWDEPEQRLKGVGGLLTDLAKLAA
jgi:transcription-repair coupling factor (superfamily II helicase)